MGSRLRFLGSLGVVLLALVGSFVSAARAQPADLVVREFLLDSAPAGAEVRVVSKGAIVHLSATIANAGLGAAGPFAVEFSCRRVDEEAICCVERKTVPDGLGPGNEVSVEADENTVDLVPGTYEIAVRIDPENQILEQDETNNRKTALLTILPFKPELHPTSLDFDPPSPVGQGETVRISAEIVNSGENTAGAFAVRFLLHKGGIVQVIGTALGDWTSLGTSVVPGLKRDEHLTLEQVLDTATLDLDSQEPQTVTPYAIRVVVDALDQVSEEDETNNEILGSLGIEPSNLSLPELHPVSLTFDRPLPLGWAGDSSEEVTATVLVANSGGSTVEFRKQPIRISFAYRKLGTSDWTDAATDRPLLIREDLGIEEGKNTATASVDLAFKEPGNYELRASVDPDPLPNGTILEQNERNNQIVVGFSVRGVELHPLSIELGSAPVHRGDTITVRSQIENTGERTATGFTVGFFVDDLRIATYSYGGGGLDYEDSVKAEALLDTSDLAPGNYALRVVVDPDNRVPEVDEANNVISTPFVVLSPVARKAELHPASLVLYPASPVPVGQSVLVASSVWNTGTIDAGPFLVEIAYSVDGGSSWFPFAVDEVASLARGEKTQIEGRLITAGLSAGTRYLIGVFVDPRAQVEEADETNNVLVASLFLGSGAPSGGPGTNLAVQDLAFNPSSPVPQRTSVQVCAAIANTGQAAAAEFLVEFLYRQDPKSTFVSFATKQVSGLAAGQSTLACETLATTPLVLGSVEVKIVADSSNWVSESDKTDNERTRTLLIGTSGQKPDLSPIAWRLDPPSPIAQGTPALVCVKVANLGGGGAGSFTVSYAYSLRASTAFATATASGLAGGGQIELCRGLDTSSLAPGTYEVKIAVDSEHRVSEQNEGNNEITAYFTVIAPPQPVLQTLVRTGGAVRLVDFDSASGTLYAASEDGKLYAVGREGTARAGFPVSAGSAIRALVLDTGTARTAYAGTADGKVHAIGLDTGQDAWQTPVGVEVLALALDRFGNVYAGTPERIVSLGSTGEKRWELPTTGTVRALVADNLRDVLYGATSTGLLYALTQGGVSKWQVDLGSPLAALALGETVYAGTDDGVVYSVSFGGTMRAAFTASGAIAAVVADRGGTTGSLSIYVASLDGTLTALDRNLVLRWVTRAGGAIHAAPRVDPRSGVIVFGADDGKLHGVNPDGSQAFAINVGEPIRSSPWIDVLVERSGNGVDLLRTIQFGAEDHAVYLIKTHL